MPKSSELARVGQEARTKILFSAEEREVIDRVCCPEKSTLAQRKMFYLFCQTSGFDPIRREAHFVLIDGKPVWMADVNGLQRRADERPEYEGMDGPHAVYENDDFLIDDKTGKVIKHIHGVKDRGQLLGAWGVGYKKGIKPVVEFLEFKEFDTGKSTWRKMPATMIKKCVRSTILRRLFASQFGNVYGEEEMGRAIEDAKVVENENRGGEREKVPTKEELISKYEKLRDRWPSKIRMQMLKEVLGRTPDGGAQDLNPAELETVVEVLENEPPESLEELKGMVKDHIEGTDRGQEMMDAKIRPEPPAKAPPKPSAPEEPPHPAETADEAPTYAAGDPRGDLLKEYRDGLGAELVDTAIKAINVHKRGVNDLTKFEAKMAMAWLDKNHRPPDDAKEPEPEQRTLPSPPKQEVKTEEPPAQQNAAFDSEGDPVFHKCGACKRDIYLEDGDPTNPDGSLHSCDHEAKKPEPEKRKPIRQKLATDNGKTYPCHYCAGDMPMILAKVFQRRNRFAACPDCQKKISTGELKVDVPRTPL